LAREAESVIDWPTWIDVEDRVVVMLGLAFWTFSGSQDEEAPLLFASPEYTAWKLEPPVELNSTGLEFGTLPLITVTVDATPRGAVQALLVKMLYVTVPLALKLPVRLEESETLVPTTGLVDERVVAIVGFAMLTVSGSQGDVAALLLESPEYRAFQLKGPAELKA